MKSPLISIITITLNSEKYLSETIESVIRQDYSNKEHIIIDGGSTDRTLDIIRGYGNAVRYVSGVDKGISDAMNKGIILSKGSIVAHLHSDDKYHSGALSKVAGFFSADNGLMWLCGHGEYIDADGRIIKPVNFKKYSYKRLKSHNFLVHPSIFVKREVFDQVGYFDTSLKYAMDYDMWLRIGRCYEPMQSREILSSFRAHAGSISTREALNAIDEEFIVRKRNYGNEAEIMRILYFLRYRAAHFAKKYHLI